jgi:hypothetical protein
MGKLNDAGDAVKEAPEHSASPASSIVQDQQRDTISMLQGQKWDTAEPTGSYPNALAFSDVREMAKPPENPKDGTGTGKGTDSTAYWGNSDLIMFPDYGHGDPSFRENMIKEFPDLKANGAKYVAFEGVPSDFTPQWLNDPQKLDELKKSLGPLDPDSTIKMLKASVAAGLTPVGLEKQTKTDEGTLVSDMHALLSDPAGKKAFDDYASDSSAHMDSAKGQALRGALEKTLASSSNGSTPDQIKSDAEKAMKDFDMMKDTGFDFKTVSKEADSLLATEQTAKKFAGALQSDPNLLKDYTDYVKAKVAARDANAADGSPTATVDSTAEKLRTDLSKYSDPKDIDAIFKDTDEAIAGKLDKLKDATSEGVLGNISTFLHRGLGDDQAKDTMRMLNSLEDSDPTKATLARVMSQLGGAFSDKMNHIMDMDWRNHTMASKLNETLSKGKTAVFAGGGHEQDNDYGKGTPQDPTDAFGFIPKTMLGYLKEMDPKLGEPWLVYKGKRYDPRDADAIRAAAFGN